MRITLYCVECDNKLSRDEEKELTPLMHKHSFFLCKSCKPAYRKSIQNAIDCERRAIDSEQESIDSESTDDEEEDTEDTEYTYYNVIGVSNENRWQS